MKFLMAALIFAVATTAARSENIVLPQQQEDILCTVSVASAFGHRVENLRAFTAVARGCVELAKVEKYGAMDATSERCLMMLQRARETTDGSSISVDEQAITDMCLHVIEAKSHEEDASLQSKDTYINEVTGNAIFRSAFCSKNKMSGHQCVLYFRELAGDKQEKR